MTTETGGVYTVDGGGYTEGWRLDNANGTGTYGVYTETTEFRRSLYGNDGAFTVETEFIRCLYGDGGHFTALCRTSDGV